MERQNFYAEQLIGVDELMKIQSTAEDAIKEVVTSLAAQGVLSGFQIEPTNPVPSLAVVVKNGKVALQNGSFVVPGNDATIDLSVTGVVGAVGNSRWVSIVARPIELSDTPVVTPQGGVQQYRTYDSLEFFTVVGDEAADPARPQVLPSDGVLIGDVKRTYGQAQIVVADIDTSRKQAWLDIPDIVAMIAGHSHEIADVNGLEGALSDRAMVVHNHYPGEVIGLVDLLAERAPLVHTHTTFQVLTREGIDLQAMLDGRLDLSNLNGKVMTIKAPAAADMEFEIPHTLGRIPIGFLVLARSASGDLYGIPTPGILSMVDIGAVDLNVTAKMMPWLPSGVNADKPFGRADGIAPVQWNRNLNAGEIVTITASGTVTARAGERPYVDANGQAPGTGNSAGSSGRYFPTKYMNNNWLGVAGLCGAFVDVNGKVVKAIAVGRQATFTVPAGAVRLQLAINDETYNDNAGSFLAHVALTGLMPSTGWTEDKAYLKSTQADVTYIIYLL